MYIVVYVVFPVLGFVAIHNMSPEWLKYYIYVDKPVLGIFGSGDQLDYYSDLQGSDPGWPVQFNIMCDDCRVMQRCNLVNR